MGIRLFDTLTRAVRPLGPEEGKPFRFYCCGPTVYGAAHIGNFRTFVLQDVLRRVLEADGIATSHVRNITDVDDKTIRGSQEAGQSLQAFTDFWKERFHADCATLNLLPPHWEPSAVAHIPQQIELIDQLVRRGYAYQSEGSVYFSIHAFDRYGRLSHLPEHEKTEPGPSEERTVEDRDEYDQESAADFALWKARKPEDGPNYWSSPWGEGRPGWHVECSAMSMRYLGETLDLHSGGVDLVFPHHENEVAQSEAVTDKPFSRHWFHIAHLLVEGNKMSKSLGNLLTLEEITRHGFQGEELRYVLLSGHYHHPLNFTWDSLKAARKSLQRMAHFDRRLKEAAQLTSDEPEPPDDERLRAQDLQHSFQEAWQALQADLNTPEALGHLFPAMKRLEKRLTHEELDPEAAKREWLGWRRMVYALGLRLEPPAPTKPPPEVVELAEERWQAKKKKDFATADRLRESILAKGWSVKDRPDHYELVKQE